MLFFTVLVDLKKSVSENDMQTRRNDMGNNPLAVLGLFSSFHLTDPKDTEQEEILDFAANDEITEEDEQ